MQKFKRKADEKDLRIKKKGNLTGTERQLSCQGFYNHKKVTIRSKLKHHIYVS